MTLLDKLINTLTRLFAKPTPQMNPATIALIIGLIEEAVKIAPGVYDDLTLFFDNPNPSPADWQALRAKVLSKSYTDYVPASALPVASAAAVPEPVSTPAAAETSSVAQSGANGGAVEASKDQNAVPAANPPPVGVKP